MKNHAFCRKAAAILAAAVLTAGMPLCVPGKWLSAPVTAYAEDDVPFSENSEYSYKKYTDHIVLYYPKNDPDVVEIPSSIDGLPVTEIGIYAFEARKMRSLILPDTITEIGSYAFSMCNNLESVTLPDSIKRVKMHAFSQCKALKEINFPDHLVETENYTFDETPWMEAQRAKDPLVIVNGAVIDGHTCKGDVVIPKGVKYVGYGAFSRNNDITSVVFPASVTNFQQETFFYCENLTSVEMPGISGLGIGVFSYCSKLTDLKLSGKIKSIDGYTFSDNSATGRITFYGSQSTWNAVEKPQNDGYLQRATMIFDESHQDPPDEVTGDINADGKCDAADAGMLLKYLLTSGTLTTDQAKIADMNKDGRLDASDLSKLKTVILSGN